MKTAGEELKRIEETTDWPVLVDLALDDPPNPCPLYAALKSWNVAFTVVYGGPPLEPDFPEPIRGFFTDYCGISLSRCGS